ncbi:MAG TPA: alpha-glucosidase/alpha-galactosidase [Planctomycetota bacterium]|nr:alpha-glucosidase/alpha-galactosidase [Planctomycetota bacterium]
MKNTVRIVVIGAASRSFGPRLISDIVLEKDLPAARAVEVVLVDLDAERLAQMLRLAERCARFAGAPVRFSAATDREMALHGADFVLVSVAVKRMELWEQDFRIPLSLGMKHCLGENGGPGAIFHALRNFELVMPICRDVERICPDAWLLNFTNPEARILTVILTLTRVKAIGLCHGFHDAQQPIARILGRPLDELDIRTAGVNHFFTVYRLADRRTGQDLLPELAAKIEAELHCLHPLTRFVWETFGVLGMNSDDHIGEYIAYAHEFTGLRWPYGQERRRVARVHQPPPDHIAQYLAGKREVDAALVRPSGELALPIIADIVLDRKAWRPAVNVLNTGRFIGNLAADACVEVPAIADAAGIHPEHAGDLPEAFAAMLRLQQSINRLLVEAYRERSKRRLLQALLLDPLVDSASAARELIEIMFEVQGEYLPAFGA